MTSRRPRLLLGALFAAVAAAGETPTLEVAVTVQPPVAVTSFPAQILLRFDSADGGFVVFRVGFLCTPDASFSTTVTLQPRPGAEPGSVEAFVVPVENGSGVVCGPLAAPVEVSPSGEPLGTAQATAGFHLAVGCGGSRDVRTATVFIGSSFPPPE
jgi:hypothetical protein